MNERQTPTILLLSGDAAHILDVTPQTVRLMARYGGLPPTAITPGGTRLFAPGDVLRLKAERIKAQRESRR